MRLYIGIDDTDCRVKNRKKMGTGRIARKIAKMLIEQAGLNVLCVTRHQLFKEITGERTNNSSKCIIVDVKSQEQIKDIIQLTLNVVRNLVHPDSNAGVAFSYGECCQEALKLAYQIKNKKVDKRTVYTVAKNCSIQLFEICGDGSGVIGAFAAVALASTGNDGRILEKGKIREISGRVSVLKLLESGVDEVRDYDSGELIFDGLVVADKIKPAFRNFKAVLYVRRVGNVWTPIMIS